MSPRPEPPEVDRAAAGRAAIAARRARAEVKRQVASRERTAAEVAAAGWNDADSAEAGMRVRDLLLSVPSLGPTRVERVMAQLGISDKKRVGGLGPRARAPQACDSTGAALLCAGPARRVFGPRRG